MSIEDRARMMARTMIRGYENTEIGKDPTVVDAIVRNVVLGMAICANDPEASLSLAAALLRAGQERSGFGDGVEVAAVCSQGAVRITSLIRGNTPREQKGTTVFWGGDIIAV